ncbi:MAG: hypothetical protein AAF549_02650 [Pseudomonadota bacterium]
MIDVKKENGRTLITTAPMTRSQGRNIKASGFFLEWTSNLAVGGISLLTIFNAAKNPTPENLGIAAAFSVAAIYLYKLGKHAKLSALPVSQKIILKGRLIHVETLIGRTDNGIKETYNTQFTDVDIHGDDRMGLESVILKYGDRITPLICSTENNEVNELFRVISEHIRTQSNLGQDKPPPPQ